MVDIIEALRRLLSPAQKRYLIGQAESNNQDNATIIYDSNKGKTEGKSFNIPPTEPPIGDIVVSIRYSPENVKVGDTVHLDGTLTKPSSDSAFILSWKWTVKNEGGFFYSVTNDTQSLASFVMPDLNWAYVTLSVTDSNNKTASRQIKIIVKDQQPPPPPPPDKDPVAIIKPDTIVGKPSQTITVSGQESQNATSYLWMVSGAGLSIVGDSNKPTAQLQFSSTISDQTDFTVALTVSNSQGKINSIIKSIIVSDTQPPPPPGCLPSECKDPVTGQCRIIAPDEIVDENGFCKKKDIPPPPPPTEKIIKIVSVNASAQDFGKEADKTFDGDYESRWSADGVGQWIEFTFDKVYEITKVRLTGYHYDKTYSFEIKGKRFENVAGRPANTLIEYDLKSLGIISNKLRIIGHGNSSSTYNSYREIEFKGIETNQPPPPEKCPEGQCKDPQTGQCRVIGPNETVDPFTGNCVPIGPSPPPPPPPGKLTRLIAFADNDVTSGAEQVLSAIMKVPDVAEYEFVGDGPYSESGTKWVSMMKKYFNTPELENKLRLSQGNHEHDESESDQTEEDIEEWLPKLNKSPEGLDWTSAGQIGNVYVISGNTQDLDVEFKRDQFNWLKGELEKAKSLRAQGQIDWIVYMAHKPFFTLKSSHSPYTAVRNNYKEIFRDAQVDFVLHGHNHNTQLWLPMIPNQSDANGEGEQLFSLMPDGKTFDFTKDHGWLGIVTGHAGHEWNGISDSGNGHKNVMHYRDSGKFGFTQLDFNGRRVNVKSIDSDGTVHFEYNVSREGSTNPPPPPPPPPECPPGQVYNPITKQCEDPTQPPPPPPPPPEGEIDQHGIEWKVAKGAQTMIEQSRTKENDYRWSGNYDGCRNGFEATAIFGFEDVASGGHFAMKQFGGNHSGSGASRQRWYDTGIRANGKIQLQWEGPHPSNHSFNLPKEKWFITDILKQMDGNTIGLKWAVQTMKPDGSPEDGGIRCRMWVDKDPLDANDKPRNNWELVYDFIDGVDVQVIDPQSYKAPDEQDMEIRVSDCETVRPYAGGLHVRRL